MKTYFAVNQKTYGKWILDKGAKVTTGGKMASSHIGARELDMYMAETETQSSSLTLYKNPLEIDKRP